MTSRLGRTDLFALAALLLVLLIALWPVVTLRATTIQHDVGISDLTHNNLPMRVHLGRALREGSFPVWMPSIYGGFPFLAQPEAGAAYPPNLLLYGLLPPLAAHNLSLLLPFLIAGVGLYLFCRELELDAAGSLLGAMAFAWSGFFVSHVKHMGMVSAACWLPAILLCIERGLARRRPFWLLVGGGLFGLQALAGHPQASYYIGLTAVAYFLARGLRSRPFAGVALAPWFFVALLLGAGIAAVQILPTLELVSLSRRAGGLDFAAAAEYPYTPRDALTFLAPYVNGDPGRMTYRGTIFWENYGYLGLLPFLLALGGGLLAWRSSWQARFFAVLGVVAFLFVLGPHTPVYRVLFPLISGLGAFRFPTRYLLLVDLSLAVLAAIGWTELRRRLSGRASKVALTTLGAVALLATAVELPVRQLRQLPMVSADRWLEPPPVARQLSGQPGRIFSIGALESHVQAYRRAGGWQGDLEPYVEQRAMLQPSSHVLWGLSSVDGYVNLVPTYLASVWGQPTHEAGQIRETFSVDGGRLRITPGLVRLARLWNVRHLVSLWPARHPALEPIEVSSPYFVYRVRDVLPRAFVVPGYVVADGEEARALLVDPTHDFRRSVILTTPPPTEQAAADAGSRAAEIVRESATEVRVRVESDGAGFLVLSDTFYPGWDAEIDGRLVPILRANVSQRAVPLAPGDHEVRFRFRSSSIRYGLALSAVSAVLLGLALVLTQRKSSRRHPTSWREP